jgi:hypothetical protein
LSGELVNAWAAKIVELEMELRRAGHRKVYSVGEAANQREYVIEPLKRDLSYAQKRYQDAQKGTP